MAKTRATLTHSELKDWLSDTVVLDGGLKLTKKQSDDALKAIFQKAASETIQGKDVKLLGLGTLKRTERVEKKGRNPLTKEEIMIPAHYAMKLDAEKAIKDQLKEMPITEE